MTSPLKLQRKTLSRKMQAKYSNKRRVIGFFLLLTVQRVNCETGGRQELSTKFSVELRTQSLELYEAHVEALKALCEKLRRVAKPTAEQTQKLQNDISYFAKLSKDKHQMSTAQLITTLKTFVVDKYLKYLRGTRPRAKAYEVDELDAMTPIMESLKSSEADANEFALSIYNSWTQLYATLSKAELAKHAEYARINELMRGVERTQRAAEVFQVVIKAMTRFLEYTDWDFFFDVKK